jgi:hypothetical protein
MPRFVEIPFSDSKEFESYVCDYFSIQYSTEFATYGSAGQNQYGIDGLHYSPSNNSKVHVIQCKNWNAKELKLSDILADIEKTKNLKVKFDVFHFVTSSKKNTKLQDEIANNLEKLTNNFSFDFQIHYYSDFFNDSLRHRNIVNKYFPMFLNEKESPQMRDTKSLLMLARFIESPFVDIPHYISRARMNETPAYSSLECLSTFQQTMPDGIFYDPKLNEYVEIFLDYIERIDHYRISYYEFKHDLNIPRLFHLKYIGKPEEYNAIVTKIENLIENFSETFKRFLSYIKRNHYDFDIFKNYYVPPNI